MTEYQYYELRALDKRLTAEQQRRLRSLSSRAEISATRLANEYSYGEGAVGRPYARSLSAGVLRDSTSSCRTCAEFHPRV